MKYEIRGENLELTAANENYITEKVDKILRYFDEHETDNAIVHVNVATRKFSTDVEVTIPLTHITLRATDSNTDFYAAVDLIADKLERQIRKYKTRINRDTKRRRQVDKAQEQIFAEVQQAEYQDIEDDEFVDDVDDVEIVKTKHFSLKPMNEIEACLQMDMLNHDFYIYKNSETDETNIVYRRKDGKYGLIEVE